jgi:hypothetical protein
MLRRLLSQTVVQHQAERRARRYRELVRREAEIGGKIFGPVKSGGRREFFCLDENTCIWHEEWVDEKGQRHVVTTRYDIKPQGVLKAQDGQPYHYISLEEAERLLKAVKIYNERVQAELYANVA